MKKALFYSSDISFLDSLGNEKKRYNAKNVVEAIVKLIDNNFRGLAEVSFDLPDDAEIFVSVESLAVLFKEIFDLVLGRALLKMDFCLDFGKLVMYLSPEPRIECGIEDPSRIIRLARDVGFDLVRDDDRIVFIIDSAEKINYTVYVPIVKNNVESIYKKIENVFYSRKELENG